MKKKSRISISAILLLLSLLMVSCTESEYNNSAQYSSLNSYTQTGDSSELKNKSYNYVSLSEQGEFKLINSEIYNLDYDTALRISSGSAGSVVRTSIISKTAGIIIEGENASLNIITSEIASSGETAILVTDKAIMTASGIELVNVSETGAGITVRGSTAVILNNSTVKVYGAGIITDAIINVNNTDINADKLVLYSDSSATFSDSHIITENGIMILGEEDDTEGDAKLEIEKSNIDTSYGTSITVINTDATVNIYDSVITQNAGCIISVTNADATVTVRETDITGDLLVHNNGRMNILLKDRSNFNGSIPNTTDEYTVIMQIEKGCTWNVTSDSYIKGLIAESEILSGIISNGYTIYYDDTCTLNTWLDHQTIVLPGGGKLIAAKTGEN
ncbi:MAG: hypothetical protein WCY62_06230 [Clostridia bacterium]